VSWRRAVVLAALAGLGACGGERPRPGPPLLTLDLPPGNVVTSPDTFIVWVQAQDDNGIDSLIVSFLDQIRDVAAFNETDVLDGVFFTVPAGREVGELIEIFAYARDLVGASSRTSTSVTVAASAPPPP